MEPEEGEDGNEQDRHDDIGPVQNRVVGFVVVIGMGEEEDEVLIDALVALAARLDEPLLGDGGFGIVGGKLLVGRVAVRATGHIGGVAEAFHLSVVAFFVGFHGEGEDVVSFHHGFIGVAGETGLGMEFLGRDGYLRMDIVHVKFPNVVEPVAVRAGRRIEVPFHDPFAMDAHQEVFSFLFMAAATHGDDLLFVFLVGFQLVDVGVAVDTSHVVVAVDRHIVGLELVPVAILAFDLSHGDLTFRMGLQVVDVPVAARAGILTMDGSGKCLLVYLIVTLEALVYGIAFGTRFLSNDLFFRFEGPAWSCK